jgi:DNA-binding CsgD family transcriptional regulator
VAVVNDVIRVAVRDLPPGVAAGLRGWLRRNPCEAVLIEMDGAPGQPRPVPRLSEREHTALCWWLRSMTKASVARRMGVSPHTVDMYIKRIRAKYAAAGRPVPTKADLLARAVEDGLVDL